MGLSDHVILTYDADHLGGSVDISRALEGTAWLEVRASPGSVRSCNVHGIPAVCVDWDADHIEGPNTFAFVFVLEDATLDPHGVVLRLYSEEIPLTELVLIAKSIVGA